LAGGITRTLWLTRLDNVYVAFGFALSIEATVVSMFTPLQFPWNIFSFVFLGAATAYLFLFDGWFQDKLMGQIRYVGYWHDLAVQTGANERQVFHASASLEHDRFRLKRIRSLRDSWRILVV
jgi:hypothetical protein